MDSLREEAKNKPRKAKNKKPRIQHQMDGNCLKEEETEASEQTSQIETYKDTTKSGAGLNETEGKTEIKQNSTKTKR